MPGAGELIVPVMVVVPVVVTTRYPGASVTSKPVAPVVPAPARAVVAGSRVGVLAGVSATRIEATASAGAWSMLKNVDMVVAVPLKFKLALLPKRWGMPLSP